jgi:hypothetical protein
MTTHHTPGPWAFSQSTEYGDTRFYVAQADGAPYTPHYSDVATLIAETVNDERKSIQEANARLIAAAPELLEALQHLMVAHGEQLDYAFQQAQDAIAKATGENL